MRSTGAPLSVGEHRRLEDRIAVRVEDGRALAEEAIGVGEEAERAGDRSVRGVDLRDVLPLAGQARLVLVDPAHLDSLVAAVREWHCCSGLNSLLLKRLVLCRQKPRFAGVGSLLNDERAVVAEVIVVVAGAALEDVVLRER